MPLHSVKDSSTHAPSSLLLLRSLPRLSDAACASFLRLWVCDCNSKALYHRSVCCLHSSAAILDVQGHEMNQADCQGLEGKSLIRSRKVSSDSSDRMIQMRVPLRSLRQFPCRWHTACSRSSWAAAATPDHLRAVSLTGRWPSAGHL